jgi:hypothetical protein
MNSRNKTHQKARRSYPAAKVVSKGRLPKLQIMVSFQPLRVGAIVLIFTALVRCCCKTIDFCGKKLSFDAMKGRRGGRLLHDCHVFRE